MPDLPISPIVILAIAGQQTMHDAAYWIFPALKEQVYVVWHQTVGIEIEGEPRLLCFQQSQYLRVILMRTENALPIVAASHYVVEPALDPRLARHLVGILHSRD